jgi:hypothetical protein
MKGQVNDDLCLWSPRNHHGRVLCVTSATAAYYRDYLKKKFRRKIKNKNRTVLLGDRPLILHENARPLLGKVVMDLLSKYKWEVLPHAPYSPDMSPPDFDLFHKLKHPISWILMEWDEGQGLDRSGSWYGQAVGTCVCVVMNIGVP